MFWAIPTNPFFSAIYGATHIETVEALGVLETYSAASIIVAADVAAKTAEVELIELRIAKGMCGKSYMLITGSVASVTAAIEKTKAQITDNGFFLDSSIIARPDEKLWQTLL